ncbi:DUF6542 domain-containing protein [Nocardioides pinisoli]|uniref:DUF6542 domain-containing protein n=1 Tax=Nocardioides pinisoli TaxID=2950279 RepID=A0ABT1KYN2_9ACTN|nr:DUF6542 domain-containing protein [Nocardioides pinisoli]MCP3422857.1 hypothetical protein [Nocardioides pinisoli]
MTRTGAFGQAGQEPGRQVVLLGVALTLTAVAVDVLLVGSLTLFFDLCFMALCLGLAALVRRQDFYLVALLPPVLMVAVFAFVSLVARDAIADPRDSVLQAVVSGVATHGIALFVGYALCLGWLAWRLHRKGDLVSELEHELGQPAR